MRIAFLSDIHGNLDALSAVINKCRSIGITQYYILGDYVGYYYRAKQCIELLENVHATMIAGNHENILLQIHKGKINREVIKDRYGSGHDIALKELTDSDMAKIEMLPKQKLIHIDKNTAIYLCHGSPDSQDEYLYPDTPPKKIEGYLKKHKIIACGHTHHQFIYRQSQSEFLFNPGSVGQPRQLKSNGACWAVLNLENLEVEFMQTDYSKTRLLNEIDKNDPQHKYLKTVLNR